MVIVYEVLRMLSELGWRQKSRIGNFRLLEHPARPGVFVTLRGKLTQPLTRQAFARIRAAAGIEEEPK